MAGSQHFSPGDIQCQLVYDRGQRAESSYLTVALLSKMAHYFYSVNSECIEAWLRENVSGISASIALLG